MSEGQPGREGKGRVLLLRAVKGVVTAGHSHTLTSGTLTLAIWKGHTSVYLIKTHPYHMQNAITDYHIYTLVVN